jgi:sugar lactone lactonase YvrE
VPAHPGGLGWLPDGELLIVSMKDRRLLLRGETYVDLSSQVQLPLNDMVVDTHGRAYVGNFGFDLLAGEAPRATVLLRVDPDRSVHQVASELVFPNGTVISPDGQTMIIAETFGYRLSAFDVAADGALHKRRTFADLAKAHPDGISLDAESCVWAACPRERKVMRIRGGGEVLAEMTWPDRKPFAVMLGGEERRDLYICSSTDNRPDVTVKERAGRIERMQVDVAGVGRP